MDITDKEAARQTDRLGDDCSAAPARLPISRHQYPGNLSPSANQACADRPPRAEVVRLEARPQSFRRKAHPRLVRRLRTRTPAGSKPRAFFVLTNRIRACQRVTQGRPQDVRYRCRDSL